MDVLGVTEMCLVEEGFKHTFKNEKIWTEIRTVEWGLRPKYWGGEEEPMEKASL